MIGSFANFSGLEGRPTKARQISQLSIIVADLSRLKALLRKEIRCQLQAQARINAGERIIEHRAKTTM